MNYNLKVEMERVNGKFVTQVELAGIGRARRERFVSETFPEALDGLKAKYDQLYGELEAYHKPAVETTADDLAKQEAAKVPAAAPAPKTEKVKGGKGGKGTMKGGKAQEPAKGKAAVKATKTKAPGRRFAAEE